MPALVYLIPSFLSDDAVETIPAYIVEALRQCTVIFAENERTVRRFLKSIWPGIVIDDYEWFPIHKMEEDQLNNFKQKIREDKTIAIISEAGCPGVADPGQKLIAAAQELNCKVKPLVGPSSILLALMASGMNGQRFEFAGYLPIDTVERIQALKDIESTSRKKNSTQVFIETPYRNDALLETILKTCHPHTRLCIAADITAKEEFIKTTTIDAWKNKKPALHKRPVIFLLYAGNP